MADFGQYSHAVIRGVPTSLARDALRMCQAEVDLAGAQRESEVYHEILEKRLGLKVVKIPADEAFPDCVFVEDAAVVWGDTALITRPGAESRRGEVGRHQPARYIPLKFTKLKKKKFDMKVERRGFFLSLY